MTHIVYAEKMLIMKIFLSVLILIFSFQSFTRADDISSFQIEGISIGDSLLDYFKTDKIKNFGKVSYPSSDKFVGWESTSDVKFENYDYMTFYVKKKDNNFKIFSMKGMKDYNNQLDQCLKEKKNVVKIIEDNLQLKKKIDYDDNYAGKYGKSKAYITDFDLSGGGVIRIWCSNWDKKIKVSKNWTDALSVSANSKEYWIWLNSEAYK